MCQNSCERNKYIYNDIMFIHLADSLRSRLSHIYDIVFNKYVPKHFNAIILI